MLVTENLAKRVLNVVDNGLCRGIGKPIPGQLCVLSAVCHALGEAHGDSPFCVAQALHVFYGRFNDLGWSSDAVRAKALRRSAVAMLGTADPWTPGAVYRLDNWWFNKKLIVATISKLLPKVLRGLAAVYPEQLTDDLKTAAAACEVHGTAASAYRAAAILRYLPGYTGHSHLMGRPCAEGSTRKDTSICQAGSAGAEAAQLAGNAALLIGVSPDVWNAGMIVSVADLCSCALVHAGRASGNDSEKADVVSDRLFSEFAEDVVTIMAEEGTPGSQFLYLTEQP